jgi:hypothetical protein
MPVGILAVCLIAVTGAVSVPVRPGVRSGTCHVRMSELSDLAAEQKRLGCVLSQVQTDLSTLRAERAAIDDAIARKRATQSEVLSAIGVAYSRSIIIGRKDALVLALADRRPNAERVELLIAALLAASPRAASAPFDASSKRWRQVWPKLKLIQALTSSPQPPPKASGFGDQLVLAKDGDGAWCVFVR